MWSESCFAVSCGGCRSQTMALTISGARKLSLKTRVKYEGLTPASWASSRRSFLASHDHRVESLRPREEAQHAAVRLPARIATLDDELRLHPGPLQPGGA